MPEKRDKEIKTVIAEQMISDKEEKADEFRIVGEFIGIIQKETTSKLNTAKLV